MPFTQTPSTAAKPTKMDMKRSEPKLEMPLFAHESFAAHATADDRVDRPLNDDDPFDPPQECLDRVFADLSRRLIEEEEGGEDGKRGGHGTAGVMAVPPRRADEGKLKMKRDSESMGTSL